MKNPKDVNPQELSALIASRICHDLIGPIGAIVNGLELLEMAGGVPGPELELIADSAHGASARLRFFRIAFGAPGDQTLARSELVSMLGQLAQGGRTRYSWLPEGAQRRSEVKLAFLALQCCEAAMPRGGEVQIAEEDGVWTVSGSAERIAVDPGLWSWLDGTGEPVVPAPARIQYMMLPMAAEQIGRRVEAGYSDSGVSLRF